MYIEGLLVPVPKKKLKEYKKFATRFGKIWLDNGALEVHECKGDDVKKGKVTSFPQAVKLKAGETVFFSWIVYKSKAHRNSSYKKAMKDPRMNAMNPDEWLFDGMRMVFGGFKSFVKLK